MLGKVIWITALAGIGGTGLGGAAACCFRRDSERTVSLLLNFAAGVMTAVVCFDLLAEAMGPRGGLGMTVAGLLGGYVLTAGVNSWLERRVPPERRGRLFLAGVVTAVAIALHNMPEGMVIGASFARGTAERSGTAMAAVIGLHNVPEGMALAVPLRSGGTGRGKTVMTAAAAGAPTVLGALLGYFLGTLGPGSLSLALSGASGAMLYVVFGELLPESAELWRSRAPAMAVVLGMILGMLIVYA